MSAGRKQLKRIDEEEEITLKYNGAFPLHATAECGDIQAINFFSKRKHVNSYNEKGQVPLHIAVIKGHIDATALLLKMDADVNISEKSTGRTCLHQACLHGHRALLDILLKNGASVYETDKTGAYPIHLAAQGGFGQTIQQLMSVGGLVTCKDKDNRGPLHYAALYDQPTAISTLHKYHANLNEKDKLGATPLHVAAANGQLEAIKTLVKLGASLNSKDYIGETPLFHATRASQLESIRELATLGADLAARNHVHECAVHVATRQGLWQSAKQLFRSGVPVDIPYKKGMQCIHIATVHSTINVIALLAIVKCDLNAKDKNGNRPLHYAVSGDLEEAISKLVELGANINSPGKRGDTCMHMAAKHGKVKILQLLAKLEADCNIENKSGLFPLYYAIVNKDLATARCLKRCGADPNKLNKEGDGMVHILVEEQQFQGLSTLVAVKGNLGLPNQEGMSVVHMASVESNVTTLKHMKEAGADLNITNKYGLAAIHIAVMDGKGEEVDMLYDIGADMNCQTENFNREDGLPLCRALWPPQDFDMCDYWKIKTGLTPVHLALLHSQDDILSHLVTSGADINKPNDDGETVFHLTVLYNMLETIKRLLTLGADRNCKDKRGRTPLHYAAHTGSLDCIRVLLKYGALITEMDSAGRQALHYAAEAGHFLLLPEFTSQNRAVDLDCRDSNGFTPLHFACKAGQMDTIIELVQLNADIEAKDNDGNTVVHLASAAGQHEVIAQLASLGCSMDIKNKEYKTPLHMAGEMGQGEAMEILLLCGCNPGIRDSNDNLASTFRLPNHQKQSVAKRIKQFNEHNSSRHKTGEVSYECKMVRSGKPIVFEKLGIIVTLTSNTKVKPIIFLHRTPADSAYLDIAVKGLEQILSDVYELRVLCLDEPCSLMLEVPLDGYPGRFEAFFRTTDGDEYDEITTSEENGIPGFVSNMPIERGTVKKFAVVVRPRVYSHSIGPCGGTIISEEDRRIRFEVPEGVFAGDTNVHIQVLKTRDIERSCDSLFAADIVNFSFDAQPRGRLRIQFPLHAQTDKPDDIVVFQIANEDDMENDFKWSVVQSALDINNACLMFNIYQSTMLLPVYLPRSSPYNTDAAKRIAKERIKGALQRETSVLFFYAIAPKKDSYLTILECTTPGRFQRRSEFWENEGFFFHPQVIHSGHFPAKPNQSFFFEITGNLQFIGQGSKRLRLTFNPRSYKYQSFYLTRVEKKSPLIGEISVMTSPDVSTTNDDVVLTNIPMEIPETSSCILS